MSAELHGMLHSVEVQDDWWPDHSFFFGRFQGGRESIARFVWMMPKRPEHAAALSTCNSPVNQQALPVKVLMTQVLPISSCGRSLRTTGAMRVSVQDIQPLRQPDEAEQQPRTRWSAKCRRHRPSRADMGRPEVSFR